MILQFIPRVIGIVIIDKGKNVKEISVISTSNSNSDSWDGSRRSSLTNSNSSNSGNTAESLAKDFASSKQPPSSM